MKSTLGRSLLILLTLVCSGCSNVTNSPPGQPPPSVTGNNGLPAETIPDQPAMVAVGQSRESLGGLRLGMTAAEVEKILGNRYQERIEGDPGGPFGEGFSVRTYLRGCDVVMGHSSGIVLQIEAYSPALPTAMGVRVGDKAIPALQLYRGKYSEWVGNQSPEILPGWFETEPGILLVFSSRESRERSNYDLGENSQIQAITLGYAKYFD